MSQKKVLLYSPDGKEECWFMEDEAPAGWVRHKPEVVEELKDLSGNGNHLELTDDERLAEAERLQGEGRMEEAEVVLEETQDDGH